MSSIKYSIVIPCYNAESTIADSIFSIINQKYKNIELIVINDGSTDGSEKVIKEIIRDNPLFEIKYKKIVNSGPSVARNVGIDMATGDYISFLDSDDTYDLNLFKELSEIKIPADIYYFGWIEVDENGKVFTQYSKKYNFLEAPINGKKAAIKKYNEWLWLCNCNETYSLKMINDNHIRYPDGVFSGEDTSFIYKCLCHAKSVFSLSKDYFYNNIHSNSLMHSHFNERFLTLFKSTFDLYSYSKENFDKELTEMFFSLYYCSQLTIAKKISESLKWYNPHKFSKLCRKYIPKIKKETPLVLNKKRRIEVKLFSFSKVLFFFVYKALR